MLQTQTNNTQSKSEPHPYIQGDLLALLDSLRAWQAGNPTAPLYQVADASPAQQVARNATWLQAVNGANNLPGQFAPALSYLSDAASGKHLDAGNTAMAGKLEALFGPMTRNLTDKVMPALNATFGGAGRTNSGLHVGNTMDAYGELAQAQANATKAAAVDVFNTERGLQSTAATALPGVLGQMGGQAANWLNMLQSIGASDTADTQRRLDTSRANFFVQPDFLTGMAQRNQSMFPGGQTLGNGTTQGWTVGGGGGGGFGSIAGPLMQGAGLAMQALPMLGFSDARLKDIEGRVGETDEGVPLYLYRYKRDGQPRIGPVAQEVAEIHPEAVARHPSGYLMIDYRKATPPGGLL